MKIQIEIPPRKHNYNKFHISNIILVQFEYSFCIFSETRTWPHLETIPIKFEFFKKQAFRSLPRVLFGFRLKRTALLAILHIKYVQNRYKDVNGYMTGNNNYQMSSYLARNSENRDP